MRPANRTPPRPDLTTAVRPWLIAGLVGTLVLPVFIALLGGLGALLRSLDDAVAARACGWLAVAVGVVWLGSVVATTALSAMAVLVGKQPRERSRRPRRRRAGPPTE